MKKKTILDPDQPNDVADDRSKADKTNTFESPRPSGIPQKGTAPPSETEGTTIDKVRPPLKKFDKVDVSSRLINMVLDMSLSNQLKLLRNLDRSDYERARKHVRKPHVFVVDCETEDLFFQEYIKDISAGGLFLRSQHPMVAGQEIRMTFQLPHHEKIFHVLGQVARISRDGVGIRFIRQEQLKPKRAEKEDNDV